MSEKAKTYGDRSGTYGNRSGTYGATEAPTDDPPWRDPVGDPPTLGETVLAECDWTAVTRAFAYNDDAGITWLEATTGRILAVTGWMSLPKPRGRR